MRYDGKEARTQQTGVYPTPWARGLRDQIQKGRPDTENPWCIGIAVLREGLRPGSQNRPDHGVGVDPSLLKNLRYHASFSKKSATSLIREWCVLAWPDQDREGIDGEAIGGGWGAARRKGLHSRPIKTPTKVPTETPTKPPPPLRRRLCLWAQSLGSSCHCAQRHHRSDFAYALDPPSHLCPLHLATPCHFPKGGHWPDQPQFRGLQKWFWRARSVVRLPPKIALHTFCPRLPLPKRNSGRSMPDMTGRLGCRDNGNFRVVPRSLPSRPPFLYLV